MNLAAIISSAATLIALTNANACDVTALQPLLVSPNTTTCSTNSNYVMSSMTTPTDLQMDIICTDPACQSVISQLMTVAPNECTLGPFSLYADLINPLNGHCKDMVGSTTGSSSDAGSQTTPSSPTTTTTTTTNNNAAPPTPSTPQGTTVNSAAPSTAAQTEANSANSLSDSANSLSDSANSLSGSANLSSDSANSLIDSANSLSNSANSPSDSANTEPPSSGATIVTVSAGAVVAAVVATLF
ncbi:unnamed protein product [Peronospora belbahrii]|uniref:Elicitin n=1 Tax=Peronospora belbahrii TaxID=622444 RepID=A0ABN8CYG9_9STRA|nr:unnamed protein product [Peronospora belbahrii]